MQVLSLLGRSTQYYTLHCLQTTTVNRLCAYDLLKLSLTENITLD
jgi:hypothetical protein